MTQASEDKFVLIIEVSGLFIFLLNIFSHRTGAMIKGLLFLVGFR